MKNIQIAKSILELVIMIFIVLWIAGFIKGSKKCGGDAVTKIDCGCGCGAVAYNVCDESSEYYDKDECIAQNKS